MASIIATGCNAMQPVCHSAYIFIVIREVQEVKWTVGKVICDVGIISPSERIHNAQHNPKVLATLP